MASSGIEPLMLSHGFYRPAPTPVGTSLFEFNLPPRRATPYNYCLGGRSHSLLCVPSPARVQLGQIPVDLVTLVVL